MRLKYQGFLLQLFFFPLTTFALEEKECVIEFENNSSKNITNEDNLNYCLSALANKKIENISAYGSSSSTGSLKKNNMLASERTEKSISILKQRFPGVPIKIFSLDKMKSLGTKATLTFLYREPTEIKNIELLETKISEMETEIKNRDGLLASADYEMERLKKSYNNKVNQEKNERDNKSNENPDFRLGSLVTYDTYYKEGGINYLSLGTEFTWLNKKTSFRPEIGAKIKTSIPNLMISDSNVQITNAYAILGWGMSFKELSAGLRILGGKEWIKVTEKNIDKNDLAFGGEARIGYETKKGPSIFLTYSLTNNLQMVGLDVGLSF